MRFLLSSRTLHLAALFMVLAGCIEVEPYVDIKTNEFYTPLETDASVLSEQDKTAIRNYLSNESYFDACLVIQNNKEIFSYGEINIPFNSASVRKSIFSAVYGIAEAKGIVNLDATLAELGIDDSINPLTETEKTATIRHLLTARSGIYLPSAGESEGMKRRKPARGTHLPNEHFYYNNWDFNALPIILERLTGMTIGEIIHQWLAEPTGMQTFQPDNVTYQPTDLSEYAQTRVYITAEDLARIGMLYANGGQWKGSQVVPANWVDISTQAVSVQPEDADLLENEVMEGYAYLWWVDMDENTFWADGAGGHFLIVDRVNNLVVVLRNNTGFSPAGYINYQATERWEGNENANEIYKLVKSKLQ